MRGDLTRAAMYHSLEHVASFFCSVCQLCIPSFLAKFRRLYTERLRRAATSTALPFRFSPYRSPFRRASTNALGCREHQQSIPAME